MDKKDEDFGEEQKQFDLPKNTIKQSNEYKFKKECCIPKKVIDLSPKGRKTLENSKKKLNNNFQMINIIGQKKYNQLQKPEQTALHSKGSIDIKKLTNSNQQSSQLQLCDPIDPFESKESVRPFEPGELGPAVEINQQSLINFSEPNLKLMS